MSAVIEKPRGAAMGGDLAMDSKSLEQLRQKYADLCIKYEQTVGKLQRQTIDEMGTHRLGLWAMQTQAAGVAVVDEGQILITNASWAERRRL